MFFHQNEFSVKLEILSFVMNSRLFHHQLYELWPVRKVSLREREVEEKGSGCTVFHDL